MSDLFYNLNAATLGAAIIVGLVIGAVYLPEMRFHRNWAMPLAALVSGVAFDLVLGVTRYLEGSPTWDRILGTAILWVPFCACLILGQRIRDRFRPYD